MLCNKAYDYLNKNRVTDIMKISHLLMFSVDSPIVGMTKPAYTNIISKFLMTKL